MKKYWIRRHPILTLMLILLLPLVLRGSLNYSGFCWAEKRWLSDEERIDAAIEHLIAQEEMYLDGVDGLKYYKVIPYKSVAEFKEKNHDCCSMAYFSGFQDYPFQFWDGFEARWLPLLLYKGQYEHQGRLYSYEVERWGGEIPPVEFINNCGISYNPPQ
jgi:hypothetical protein